MSQQGLLQASIRAITGTHETFNGDWHALFDLDGIPAGMFNERLLRWINAQLGRTYTNLPEAQQAYATAQGVYNWSALGSVWTPAILGSSLLGWWDAEDASTITLSGSTVTSWRDKVAGYDAAQGGSSALRPIYGASSFNGRPGITFDGIDDELTLASVPFPTGANPCEIWALVDQTALAADVPSRAILAYGDLTAARRALSRGVTGGVVASSIDASGVTRLNVNVSFVGRHVARGIVTSTSVTVHTDGVATITAAVVPATSATRTRLGALCGTTATNFWQGVIPFLAVTEPLTDAQASQLLTYLKARGGIA